MPRVTPVSYAFQSVQYIPLHASLAPDPPLMEDREDSAPPSKAMTDEEKEEFHRCKAQQDGEAAEGAAAMMVVEGAGKEGGEGKNPYKEASQNVKCQTHTQF